MDKIQRLLHEKIKELFPNNFLPYQVQRDFAHLLYGNALHVFDKLKNNGHKPVIVDHAEQVVCLGSGFDWLHKPNFALIVNPLALEPREPFITQLKILRSNLKLKRIPKRDGLLVMVSVSFKELRDKRHSILKAISLVDFAQKIIEEEFKDLVESGMQMIVGIMDENTRLFEPIHTEKLKLFSDSDYKPPRRLNKIAQFIVKHNQLQHDEFTNLNSIIQRGEYLKNYPTKFVFFKCMDGRVNFAIATKTPMGIIKPMRNVGAIFHFGWKPLYDKVSGVIEEAIVEKTNCVLVPTYHFSRVNTELCCAGHGYDLERTKANSVNLLNQTEFTFGGGNNGVVSVMMLGYNTDIDSIIVHGTNGDVFDMEDFVRENFEF